MPKVIKSLNRSQNKSKLCYRIGISPSCYIFQSNYIDNSIFNDCNWHTIMCYVNNIYTNVWKPL